MADPKQAYWSSYIKGVDPSTGKPKPIGMTGDAAHVDASPHVVSIGGGNDVTTYDPPLVGVRPATAGNIKVVSNGATVTISSVLAGEHLPGNFTKIFSTDTTAGNIIGWQR